VNQALAELRRLEGGFVAQPGFDDWVSYPGSLGQPGLYANGIQMMGCCSPEGMRGLWEAWNGAVEVRPDGLYVNLAFTRDHPAAKLVASRPDDGALQVTLRRRGKVFLRPPAWADRASVRLERNGLPQAVAWGGTAAAYVVTQAKRGEVLTLRWPVPRFTQTFQPSSIPGRSTSLTVHWIGNEVVGVTPSGRYLRMFGRP
jgi:hypothetical protein